MGGEGGGGPNITANATASAKCPVHLLYNMLEDCVERANVYDKNVIRQRSLLRHNGTKRMVQREVTLRKPKLILRHSIEMRGPHKKIKIKAPGPPPGEGAEGGEDPAAEGDAPAAEPPADEAPAAEGEEGAEKQKVEDSTEEEITTSYIILNIEAMGTVISEMEPVTGQIKFTATEADEELCDLEVDIAITSTSSDPPEGLQEWVDSLTSGLKILAGKMVYLSPMLGNPSLYSVNLHRSIMEKAKRFEFISQHLLRSQSAQSCLLDGSAKGSLQYLTPPRPMSSLN